MVSRRFAAGFALAAVLLLLCSTAAAQQSYEGLATIGSFGRFPTGLFGASNLVPPNTLVTVRNLETGRSERVIITDNVRESGVFLVLSPEAAESLEIDPGGATRVRLSEIPTGGAASVDPASERPLSPDPDINPLAADSLVETLPPPQPADGAAAGTTGATSADATAPEEEPDAVEPAPPLQDAVAEQVEPEPETEPTPAPEPEPEQPAKPAREKPAVADAEPEPGVRSGVAAGIARTSVGQAQESFERPDTAFPSARPEPVDVPAPAEPGEPLVEPAERAAPGLEQAAPAARPEPALPATEPQPPAVDVSDREPGPEEEAEPDLQAPSAPEEAEPTRSVEGPIDASLRSVVDRLPRKDLYPAPAGESGDVGFRRVGRPEEPGSIAELPQVSPPPVERPSLAGLAPLQAAPQELDVRLAEAAVPPEDRPDYEGLASPTAPADGVPTVRLPEAAPGEEARPTGAGLARIVPGETAGVSGPLAEAEAPEEERARLADLPSARPAERPEIDPDLAEAGIPEEERARLTDLPSAEPAARPEIDADLAEAGVPEEERARLTDLPSAEPAERPVSPAELAEARPQPEERPDGSLAAVSPGEPAEIAAEAELPRVAEDEVAEAEESLEQPETVPEDATLALEPADFRPPEAPEPDEESILERETAEAADAGEIEASDLAEADVQADEPEEAVVAETTQPRVEEEPEPRPAVVRGELPVIDRLAAEAYYLQIGAYSNPETARVAVNALSPTYPMSVLPIEGGGGTIYRVLVGPLERDETGTLLLWLRARGYGDTFVRSGTEL